MEFSNFFFSIDSTESFTIKDVVQWLSFAQHLNPFEKQTNVTRWDFNFKRRFFFALIEMMRFFHVNFEYINYFPGIKKKKNIQLIRIDFKRYFQFIQFIFQLMFNFFFFIFCVFDMPNRLLSCPVKIFFLFHISNSIIIFILVHYFSHNKINNFY